VKDEFGIEIQFGVEGAFDVFGIAKAVLFAGK
jgi:hypothetical protein